MTATRLVLTARGSNNSIVASLRCLGVLLALVLTSAPSVGQDLAALAARCGSEIEWARSWSEAARIARVERRAILVVVWSYPGFAVDDGTKRETFMDPDVIELVRERCVALRLEREMDCPLRAPESYGMGPNTFGAAILVATPDAEVVAQTDQLRGEVVYDFLADVLVRDSRLRTAPISKKLAGEDLAEAHLRRGELDLAAQVLADADTSRAHRLRATLLRKQRNGEAALRELDLAVAEQTPAPEHLIERAEILLRLERDTEARTALDLALAANPPRELATRARYSLGICFARSGQRTQAEEVWTRSCVESPDSRWAWKAAATLRSTAWQRGIAPQPAWPAEHLVAAVRSQECDPLRPARVDEAVRDALAWLVRAQQPDGSWPSPTQITTRAYGSLDPFTLAHTAFAGRAVLTHRDRSGCSEAARKALEFVLAALERSKRADAPPVFMDYTVWSKPTCLHFLIDCLAARIGDEQALRKVAAELVEAMHGEQRTTGGWSYYLTHDASQPGTNSEISMSFTTAGSLLALQRARASKLEVPEAALERALDCLEALRGDGGRFVYSTGTAGGTSAEALGRGPLCELALFGGGRSDVKRLSRALDDFFDQRALLAREVGKALMHAGADGQGCHYVLYDYLHAALALGEVSAADRRRGRALLIELLLDTRLAEGSFQDTSINGTAYGTAVALLALNAIDAAR